MLILSNQPNHYIFISEFNLLIAKNLTQHLHTAMTEFLLFLQKETKEDSEGGGHLSGGNRRSKVLKKKVEGELAHRILKLVKNKFPLTGKKVCQTA